MKKTITLLALACALAVTLAAQKSEKSWTEWTQKDVDKILSDSPWAQTQVETDTSEMFWRPQDSTTAAATNPNPRNDRGQLNQATDVKYRIRFLSARPIRQAFARKMLLTSGSPDREGMERLRLFAEMPPSDKIIIAVTFESKDGRFSGAAMQAFNAATTATLKNNTYLEMNGKRVFVEEYAPPGREGFGALFSFPRADAGGPIITPEIGDVRFVSEVARNVKLNMKFKAAQMNYQGKAEY
jgi:hypothetical protein